MGYGESAVSIRVRIRFRVRFRLGLGLGLDLGLGSRLGLGLGFDSVRGSTISHKMKYLPLARREAPAEGRRPESEGANPDRRLIPYHGKCKRIQSRIEFIYLFIL